MDCFDKAVAPVSKRLAIFLTELPEEIKNQTQEIRLRVNRPVSLCTGGRSLFLKEDGNLVPLPKGAVLMAGKQDLEETFRGLCSCSVYSHQNEIKNGYITIRGGHRAGICGTAVISGGEITGLRDISSINIRVARQIEGAANELLRRTGKELFEGLLLAGPPASGKTTLLRDLARQLSSQAVRVAVVDERGELAGTYLGEPQNDLGPCCDVLDAYPKGAGILQAVRSLSPEIILCDELGGEQDVRAVETGLNAGVAMVTTIHASNPTELMRRKHACRLLETGAFGLVALLNGRTDPGKIKGIYKAGEFLDQINRNHSGIFGVGSGGIYGGP